jgi:hypothetical protein
MLVVWTPSDLLKVGLSYYLGLAIPRYIYSLANLVRRPGCVTFQGRCALVALPACSGHPGFYVRNEGLPVGCAPDGPVKCFRVLGCYKLETRAAAETRRATGHSLGDPPAPRGLGTLASQSSPPPPPPSMAGCGAWWRASPPAATTLPCCCCSERISALAAGLGEASLAWALAGEPRLSGGSTLRRARGGGQAGLGCSRLGGFEKRGEREGGTWNFGDVGCSTGGGGCGEVYMRRETAMAQ